MDAPVLMLEIDRSAFPVQVTAAPASLAKMLSIFHTGVVEATIEAHPEDAQALKKSVQLRSYLDPNKSK